VLYVRIADNIQNADNMNVKIKAERENFRMPVRSTPKAACYDLFAAKIAFNEEGDKATIYLGFSMEPEPGWKAILVPRSNITKTNWAMLNSPGQIDEDYRGEVQMRLTFIPKANCKSSVMEFPFKEGERVAQLYFEKVNPVEFNLVEILSDTDRGSGGFGHTGL
jgi:dUTP pyrophosphatase